MHKVAASTVVSVVSEESAAFPSASDDPPQDPSDKACSVPEALCLAQEDEAAADQGNWWEKSSVLKTDRNETISKLEQGLEESAGWGDEGEDDSPSFTLTSAHPNSQSQADAGSSFPPPDQSAAASASSSPQNN
ncbi:hypothetical protein ACOMHN_032817 [Nucella lapillus]